MIISKGRKTNTNLNSRIDETDTGRGIISEYSMTEFCTDSNKHQSAYQWSPPTHHQKSSEKKKKSGTLDFIENTVLYP